MMTDAFTVPAGEELQVCYFFKVSTLLQANGMDPTQPLELHRVQVVQKAGSHHMNLFRVRTIANLDPANGSPQVGINGVGQCFVSSNWSDWPLVANTQIGGDEDWSTTTPPESDRFYQSLTWSDPPMMHSPDLQQAVSANGGVWFTCSYQWDDPSTATNGVDTCATLNAYDAKKHMTPPAQQDCCYTFGPQVDVNEHCTAFIYYYPKQDNENCV